MVEAGPDAGGAVGLSPPHAARSNTRVSMMPAMDNRGKDRTTGLGSKTIPLLYFGLGVPSRSIICTLLITGAGMPRRFQGGVHSFLRKLDCLQGVAKIWKSYRGHPIHSSFQ